MYCVLVASVVCVQNWKKNYRFLSPFYFHVDHHTEMKMDKEIYNFIIYNFLFFPALNTKYTSDISILIVEKEFLFCETTTKKFDTKMSGNKNVKTR